MADKEESNNPKSGSQRPTSKEKIEKFGYIGDSKNNMEDLRKGAEIPPRTPKIPKDETKDK